MMKLFYSPGACSLSPHIVLRETKIPVTLVKTDLGSKTSDGGKDFRKTNPLGYVPALELEDGSILTEGPAIVQYIADMAPSSGLAPAAGTPDRYRMQSLLNFISTELHKGFSPLFNAAMPEEAKKIFRDKLHERFAFLDKKLAANDYLMGNAFTLPDAYLFTVLNWAKPMKLDLSAYPHVLAFMTRVGARPAVQQALREEGLI
jgi:glutathione S-transferase